MPFTFTGLRKSIANARLMVDYLMEDLKDIQKLIESREELDYQLSRLRMDSQPTNYPSPSRRTHGHSSAASGQEGTLKDSEESEMQGKCVQGQGLGYLQLAAFLPCSSPAEGRCGAARATGHAGEGNERDAGGVGGQR